MSIHTRGSRLYKTNDYVIFEKMNIRNEFCRINVSRKSNMTTDLSIKYRMIWIDLSNIE